MPTTPLTPLALMVQVEQRNGSDYRAVARVYRPVDGELRGVSWSGRFGEYGEDAARFDGLEISAYAGVGDWSASRDDESYQRLWGFGIHYAPYRVEDAKHAQTIARTFAQIERGMGKLEAEDGYIRDGEFARYVTRVAKALRIRKIYVRNVPRAFNMTGERYRLVDHAALDYWTQEVTSAIVKGELSSLVR